MVVCTKPSNNNYTATVQIKTDFCFFLIICTKYMINTKSKSNTYLVSLLTPRL